MKPVVKASIGRTAFTLEEEAFNLLKNYLDSLEAHFAGNPSGKEIMEEIEVRIAELLLEKCGPSGVVSAAMAREACDTLGSVKDIDADKSTGGDKPADGSGTVGENDREKKERTARKLYRNPYDKILGGVCSGIAAYFDKDPLLFRLLAVVIFLFFTMTPARTAFWVPIAAYLALWLAIPEARTVRQRYQMRGEKNTLESIMENVEKNADEIGDTARKFAENHHGLFHGAMRAVGAIIGTVFIIVSCAALLALTVTFAGSSAFMPVSAGTLISSLAGPGSVSLCIAAIMVTLGIPFAALLYSGILMAFNLKAPRWKPGLILLLLWIAGLGTLAYMGTKTALELDSGERQYASTSVTLQNGEPLRLKMENSDMDYDYIYVDADEDSYELFMISGDDVYIYPKVRIRRDPAITDIRIEESTVNFNRKDRAPAFCTYSDGVLTLSPVVLSDDRKMAEGGQEITISLPADAAVQVEPPRYHDFTEDQYHTNISLLNDSRNLDLL